MKHKNNKRDSSNTDKKFITAVVVATALLIFGGVYLTSNMGGVSQIQANPEAKASVKETAHDWGEIGIDEGNVEKTFEIENMGSETLALSNVITSCMCTTAQLSFNGNESPLFGMHTKSAYVLELPPNETASLKVVFDPAYHGPSGLGPITRQVEVQTNDADRTKLNFSLTAYVVR
jgi:hypothetical protein